MNLQQTIEQKMKEFEDLLWSVYSAHESPHSSSQVIKHAMDAYTESLTQIAHVTADAVRGDIENNIKRLTNVSDISRADSALKIMISNGSLCDVTGKIYGMMAAVDLLKQSSWFGKE